MDDIPLNDKTAIITGDNVSIRTHTVLYHLGKRYEAVFMTSQIYVERKIKFK